MTSKKKQLQKPQNQASPTENDKPSTGSGGGGGVKPPKSE